MPDLDVQNAGDSYPPTLSASSVIAGGSVTLTYRLSNWGSDSAPSSITGIYRSTNSTISTSDTRIGTDSNSSLSANAGRTETFTVDTTGWAAGTYYIGAVADYNNAITESNGSNNPSSGVWLTVRAPPVLLPDLDVQNAGDSYPPTLSASSVIAGGSVTLTYRLSNWGSDSAPSSITGIYRSTNSTISTSDTRIGTDSNSSLSANAGRTETFTVDTTGWAAGTYYIGAVADYNNAITESNGSNNPSSGVWLTVRASPTTTDAGNTRATATALTLGNTVSQSVGISPDIDDYYHFTATTNGRVTANLTGLSADIDLRALNSAGTQIVAGEQGGNSSESISFDVMAGQTYYLRVDPYGGVSSNYSLATTFSSGGGSASEMLVEARSHLGEDYYWSYRLNADGSRTYTTFNSTTINDSNFSGPWDCAEFVSYCIYQETGNKIGLASPGNSSSFEFSSDGWKYAIANEVGVTKVSLQTALDTVGSVIWFAGHVMMSVGDGAQVIEANVRLSGGKYLSNDGTLYDPRNQAASPGVVWDARGTSSPDNDVPMGVDIGDVMYRSYTASTLAGLGATAGVVDEFLF